MRKDLQGSKSKCIEERHQILPQNWREGTGEENAVGQNDITAGQDRAVGFSEGTPAQCPSKFLCQTSRRQNHTGT
jgi:hypothetical protein